MDMLFSSDVKVATWVNYLKTAGSYLKSSEAYVTTSTSQSGLVYMLWF